MAKVVSTASLMTSSSRVPKRNVMADVSFALNGLHDPSSIPHGILAMSLEWGPIALPSDGARFAAHS
jgi:hypothetical protein